MNTHIHTRHLDPTFDQFQLPRSSRTLVELLIKYSIELCDITYIRGPTNTCKLSFQILACLNDVLQTVIVVHKQRKYVRLREALMCMVHIGDSIHGNVL